MKNIQKLAKHILCIAHSENKSITNLKLQKVMYLTIKNSKNVCSKAFLKEVYDEPFTVWRYGPTIKTVYDEYKIFVVSPIRYIGEYYEEYKVFDEVIKELLEVDVWTLIKQLQEEDKWQENKHKISLSVTDIVYTLEDVLK